MSIHIFIPPTPVHDRYACAVMESINKEDKHRLCFADMPPETFMQLSRQPTSWLFVGVDENATGTHILGFLWLTDFRERSASLHFGFTKHGRSMGAYLASTAFHMAFDAGIGSIHGLFPQGYRHIFPFAKTLGGTNMGIIPASCRNAYTGNVENGVLWLFTPQTTPKHTNPITQEK